MEVSNIKLNVSSRRELAGALKAQDAVVGDGPK
jgi:hypothetical protein